MYRYFLIALKEALRQDKTIESFRFEYDDDICFLAYPLKIDTPESFIVLFFTTKVSTIISVEGGEALSRSLNDRIPNIW